MLKTNVIAKTYRITALTPQGLKTSSVITAESETAARMKVYFPSSWEIIEVVEL